MEENGSSYRKIDSKNLIKQQRNCQKGANGVEKRQGHTWKAANATTSAFGLKNGSETPLGWRVGP